MKVKSLSFSMISTFRQCPGKFARIYHYRDPRYIADAALEGSVFHDVVERWMPDRTQDWRKILKDVVRNQMSPFTGKRAYEEVSYEQYLGAYRLLQDFTKRNDLNVKSIAYETPFDFVLPNGVPINGRIDRVDEAPDGYLEFVDYKTTRAFIYRNEVEQSLQGAMYSLAGMYKLYPGRKFRFTIDAIRFSPITVEFSPEFLDATMDYLENTWDEIQAMEPEEAEFKPNKYCGFCPYKDDPSVCTAVQDVTKTIYGEEMDLSAHECARKIIELENHEVMIKKLRGSYERRLDDILVENQRSHADFGDCFVFYKQYARGNQLKVVDKSEGHVNADE